MGLKKSAQKKCGRYMSSSKLTTNRVYAAVAKPPLAAHFASASFSKTSYTLGPSARRDKPGTSYRVSLQRGSMKGKLQTSLYPVMPNQPPVSSPGYIEEDVPYTLRE